MKRKFLKAYFFLATQVGIDLRLTLLFCRGLPKYVLNFVRFRSEYTGPLEVVPCLHDWYEEGGGTKNEYFWQDLLVAKKIFDANPIRHVDIGSRVDGFVAHVASFRKLEVFDVRPITTQIPGITFRQVDFMMPVEGVTGYCDSLSCLHALEHFGLGRYGDPINPKGFELGLENMAGLLQVEGIFYLSLPIGQERVEFNANRVFDPRVIISLALQNSLKLIGLSVIRGGDQVDEVSFDEVCLADLACQRYALGIFTFVKLC
ncbi:DUF268 domain-containing protein [Desulfoluna spongiiphila]|uniref:DUF268 domain-containing protein n=1 Tax=Desulfoluna spongiiphila TaxID=419481 RepID=A0A1G5JFB4_9BACT|nr:DUF268 domain-containing protein [Desulfoluna spongiiphila]SCY87045.1 protein of unknown function, DUF268 [Desulfoluna spongiiphila]